MARRLGDPLLLMFACQVCFVALWTAETAVEQVGWSGGPGLARSTGSDRAYVVCATLHAAVLSEVGRAEEMWTAIATARAAAGQRIAFGWAGARWLEIPWPRWPGGSTSASGCWPRSRAGAPALPPQRRESAAASMLAICLWEGRPGEMVPVLGPSTDGVPLLGDVAVYLWRAGRTAGGARRQGLRSTTTTTSRCWRGRAADVALYLGDPALAAEGRGSSRRWRG